MAKRSIVAFSVLLFVFFVSSLVANASYGGRTKITDVKTNKEVQELGRYSVDEYNRLRRRNGGAGGGDLKFSHVVEAEKQVVSGIKYYLKIQAYSSSSGVPKIFNAEVVVKAWLHNKKQLIDFSPSPATK